MPVPTVVQTVLDANSVTTIISNINSLYANLVTYTVGLLAFAGIFVPAIISYWQNRKFKIEQRELSGKMASEIAAVKTQLIDELRKEISLEMVAFEGKISELREELRNEIEIEFSSVNAKAHHTQAVKRISDKNFSGAAEDCVTAGIGYANGKEEGNLRRVLKLLIEKVLVELKMSDFEQDNTLEQQFNALLEKIEELNLTGGYLDEIKAIRKRIVEAKAK